MVFLKLLLFTFTFTMCYYIWYCTTTYHLLKVGLEWWPVWVFSSCTSSVLELSSPIKSLLQIQVLQLQQIQIAGLKKKLLMLVLILPRDYRTEFLVKRYCYRQTEFLVKRYCYRQTEFLVKRYCYRQTEFLVKRYCYRQTVFLVKRYCYRQTEFLVKRYCYRQTE